MPSTTSDDEANSDMDLKQRQPGPPALRLQLPGEVGEHPGKWPGACEVGIGPPRIVIVRGGRHARSASARGRWSRAARAPPGSGRARMHVPLDRRTRGDLRAREVVGGLQVQPELRRGPEIAGETECGVGGHCPGLAFADDGADSGRRHPQRHGQPVGAEPERLHELLAQHLAWMRAEPADRTCRPGRLNDSRRSRPHALHPPSESRCAIGR